MRENYNLPNSKWGSFKFMVVHCYTPQVRKAERMTTCNARHEKQYYQDQFGHKDKEITSVGACLLQENLFTFFRLAPQCRPCVAHFCAADYGQHTKGTAVCFAVEQFPNGHFDFCFAVAIGKKVVCNFQYRSEIGRYEFYGSKNEDDPYYPYKQELSLEQYLKKMPEEIILNEETGKILYKKELFPIFEMIERNQNDWEIIFGKLEKLLYGRCFPLEYPDFTMKTPSTCPKGYELVDMYNAVKLGARTEIYYRTDDIEKLPKYKR